MDFSLTNVQDQEIQLMEILLLAASICILKKIKNNKSKLSNASNLSKKKFG